MTIETKYDIDQEVFIFTSNGIVKCVIKRIYTKQYTDKTGEIVYDLLSVKGQTFDLRESLVFETVDDVLINLKSNVQK